MASRNDGEQQTIPPYGKVRFSSIQSALYDTDEIQFTQEVHQLGMCKSAFPAAEHTRRIHLIGTSALASEFAKHLGLGENDRATLEAAAMLHDVAHFPYSHTTEEYFLQWCGLTHEELGRRKICEPGDIRAALEDHFLNPELIADAICGKGFFEKYNGRMRWLQQLISGKVDCDGLDYLRRDAMNAAPYGGAVDVDHLIDSSHIEDHPKFGQCVVYDEDASDALQMVLHVDTAMWRTSYNHHRSKRDEQFLRRSLMLVDKQVRAAFSDYLDDPSSIRQYDLVRFLQTGVKGKSAKALLAVEFARAINDRRKRKDAVFLRTGDPHHDKALEKLWKKFPYDQGKRDPLEEHLEQKVNGLRPYEVIVDRAVLPPSMRKKSEKSDVFIRVKSNGLSRSKVIHAEDYGIVIPEKAARNKRSLRIITLNKKHNEEIQDVVKKILRKH